MTPFASGMPAIAKAPEMKVLSESATTATIHATGLFTWCPLGLRSSHVSSGMKLVFRESSRTRRSEAAARQQGSSSPDALRGVERNLPPGFAGVALDPPSSPDRVVSKFQDGLG
jgi:hypothetical protein